MNPIDIMSVEFQSYVAQLDNYEAPERDPRDSDRAAAVFASMHRISAEHQCAIVAEDGTYHEDAAGVLGEINRTGGAEVDVPGILVDASTAGLIVQVAGMVNDTNRAKFLGLPIAVMGRISWSMAS